MIRVAFLVSLLLQISPLFSEAGDYKGKVGKMEAVFSLSWQDDGSVSGTYAYPERQGIVYTLSGNNPAEGKLYLEEYTSGKLTARCHLKKVVTRSTITWTGEMHNTDGRTLPMHFSRSRDTPSVTNTPPSPIQEGTRYTGHVGKLKAVYYLNWNKDGSVTGTYSYPDRPGTIYRLIGSNPREGELYLAEFTGDKLTARCNLSKRLTEGTIRWEGEMKNTDGRSFPIVMSREMIATDSVASPELDPEALAFLKRIQTKTTWTNFPKSKIPIEMVPAWPEGQYFSTRIEKFRNSDKGITITVTLGIPTREHDGNDSFTGPRLTAEIHRSIPIPPEMIEGCRASAKFNEKGELIEIYLGDFAVTHYRATAGGPLEIRGLFEGWEDRSALAQSHELTTTPRDLRGSISFLPDKLALGFEPVQGEGRHHFTARPLRIDRAFGVVLQSTDAGPGMLELESLSLDGRVEEIPWTFIGDESGWNKIPPSQSTGEAG